MPCRHVSIFSRFLEMVSEKYTMTANLAISDGWNWNTPLMPSHRVALLAVMASGLWGIMTSISKNSASPTSSRPAPRQR